MTKILRRLGLREPNGRTGCCTCRVQGVASALAPNRVSFAVGRGAFVGYYAGPVGGRVRPHVGTVTAIFMVGNRPFERFVSGAHRSCREVEERWPIVLYDHRRRPGGSDRGYELTSHGFQPIVLEKRWSAASPAPKTTKASILTWAGTASSPRARKSTTCGTRCSPTSSSVAALSRIYLPQEVLLLPSGPFDTLLRLGPVESTRILFSYLRWQTLPLQAGKHLRGVGHQPLRPAPLPDLLQDLHRKSLGHQLQGAQGRVGRPAHQGPVGQERDRSTCSSSRRRRSRRSSRNSTTRASGPA